MKSVIKNLDREEIRLEGERQRMTKSHQIDGDGVLGESCDQILISVFSVFPHIV